MKDENTKNIESVNQNGLKRRDILKGMASLPVLGIFGYEFSRSRKVEKTGPENILKELGLNQDLHFKVAWEKSGKSHDMIRIGIIGAGSRSRQLLFHSGFASKQRI